MKRVVMTALSAAIVLGGLAGGPPAATADNRSGQARSIEWRVKECRYQSLDKALWTDREERLTAECAVSKFIPGQLATFLRVGYCESGFNRWASNGGRYLGLFQHAASAYVSRIHTYEPTTWDRPLSTRWSNSRGQIVMTARMVRAVGWSPWTCY